MKKSLKDICRTIDFEVGVDMNTSVTTIDNRKISIESYSLLGLRM